MKLNSIELPEDMIWVNEFEFTPIEQNRSRSITGAQIIQEQQKFYGQPITLVAGPDYAWVRYLDIEGLIFLRNQIGLKMDFTHTDGRQFKVMFDHSSGRPVDPKRVSEYGPRDDDTMHSLTLRLITVEP